MVLIHVDADVSILRELCISPWIGVDGASADNDNCTGMNVIESWPAEVVVPTEGVDDVDKTSVDRGDWTGMNVAENGLAAVVALSEGGEMKEAVGVSPEYGILTCLHNLANYIYQNGHLYLSKM